MQEKIILWLKVNWPLKATKQKANGMDDQIFLLPYLMTVIPIFAFCLILTITVELIVAKSLGVKDNQALLIVVAAQVLTNPIAVFITSALVDVVANDVQYWACVIIVELVVIAVEGLIYKVKRVSNTPWTLSILANLASVTVGILVQTLI
ncbi:MAG: hypothetical protein KH394_07005 [Atopobium sp.]|nr:hypothetical protein [Atopobium sp.]